MECSEYGQIVKETLGRVADKWTLIVLDELEDGPHRFSVLLKRIAGISQKMLTQTLRGMEKDGLITRTIFPEVPPRVEYALTSIGIELGGAVCSVWKWAAKHSEAIEQSRQNFESNL